jgi:hypothetical protein
MKAPNLFFVVIVGAHDLALHRLIANLRRMSAQAFQQAGTRPPTALYPMLTNHHRTIA